MFPIFDVVSRRNRPPENVFEGAEEGNIGFLRDLMKREKALSKKEMSALLDCEDYIHGHSPLQWAVLGGYEELVKELVEKMGANVCRVSEAQGTTAIHSACHLNHLGILTYLLSKIEDPEQLKVEVNRACEKGLTPVSMARHHGQSGDPVFTFLLSKGARFNKNAAEDEGEGAAAA